MEYTTDIKRDFRLNKIWLGDSTYISLKHSTLYLFVFNYVFTREL